MNSKRSVTSKMKINEARRLAEEAKIQSLVRSKGLVLPVFETSGFINVYKMSTVEKMLDDYDEKILGVS